MHLNAIPPVLSPVGVFTTAQLLRAGTSRAGIDRLTRERKLLRIRRGWYAEPAAVDDAVQAVSRGGCLSCFSALARFGVWLPAAQRSVHVRYPRGHHRKGCRAFGASPAIHSAIDDLRTAFCCALHCGSREDIVVVADAILRMRLASLDELKAWAAAAPQRVRLLLESCDAAAESGLETITRVRLQRMRLRVRSQVVIDGMRVDLLIGDRLIVECDGRAFHGDAAAFRRDRQRDRRLLALGYLVVRLTAEQIEDDWPAVLASIMQLVRERAHEFPRHR